MRKGILLLCLLAPLAGQAQQTLALYDDVIPRAISATDKERFRDPDEVTPFLLDVSRPTLSAYPIRASLPTPAVLLLPGGSYRGVSIDKEGHAVARELNKWGIAAFVVKYRTPSPGHMVDQATGPLQDVQQAIRVVRRRASEWRIDPQRVGLLGFSAGGHLAATAAARFESPVVPDTNAPSVRPDFLILAYPVISMLDPLAHAVSRRQLLGDAPTESTLRAYSNELLVNSRTPQTFLMHAADDTSVVVDNTLRYFDALRANGVSVEMHIYSRGGHGFGLINPTTEDRWLDRARNWMASQGLLR